MTRTPMNRTHPRTAPLRFPVARRAARAGRHRTLHSVQYSCQPDGPLLCAERAKRLPLVRCQPTGSGRTFLGLPREFPTVQGPRRSCLRPCAEEHRGGASSGPGSRRRSGVCPGGGRTRRRRPSSGRTRTTSTATGGPGTSPGRVRRPQRGRGGMFGHAEASGLAFQPAVLLAFGCCRAPQRPGAATELYVGKVDSSVLPATVGCVEPGHGNVI